MIAKRTPDKSSFPTERGEENSGSKVAVSDKFALNITEVAEMTTLGKRTISRLVDKGTFPKPRKVGHRTIWIRAEVRDWMLNAPVKK